MTDKEKNYAEINRQLWNSRTGYHVKSDFYDVAGFLKGKNSLNEMELSLLGNIKNKSILHLQCHFGQDTISLARSGAAVTGVDISDEAIGQARLLAGQAAVKTDFICCNIYDLPEHLNSRFDIVFSSYGTIGWLPDLDKWARIISSYLKPGGKFVFAEFHPVVWMFDNDFKTIQYRYFKSGAIIETENNTYADTNASIYLESVSWNHSLSEVLGSLFKNGLKIISFEEYDFSPYNCFRHSVEIAPRKFRIKHLGDKIPMVYSLLAEKEK